MTVPTTADPGQVHLGPGILYVAPVATADPTTVASVTGSSAWQEVGYTEAGTTFDMKPTIAPVKVEEEIFAIKYATTDYEASISFELAETTRRHLALALNVGTGAANDGTVLTPPAPGAEVRIKIAHLSEEGAVWFAPQAINGGDLKMERKKAPNKATLPCVFNLEKVAGKAIFTVIPTSNGSV
jgi:hypothetical protein